MGGDIASSGGAQAAAAADLQAALHAYSAAAGIQASNKRSSHPQQAHPQQAQIQSGTNIRPNHDATQGSTAISSNRKSSFDQQTPNPYATMNFVQSVAAAQQQQRPQQQQQAPGAPASEESIGNWLHNQQQQQMQQIHHQQQQQSGPTSSRPTQQQGDVFGSGAGAPNTNSGGGAGGNSGYPFNTNASPSTTLNGGSSGSRSSSGQHPRRRMTVGTDTHTLESSPSQQKQQQHAHQLHFPHQQHQNNTLVAAAAAGLLTDNPVVYHSRGGASGQQVVPPQSVGMMASHSGSGGRDNDQGHRRRVASTTAAEADAARNAAAFHHFHNHLNQNGGGGGTSASAGGEASFSSHPHSQSQSRSSWAGAMGPPMHPTHSLGAGGEMMDYTLSGRSFSGEGFGDERRTDGGVAMDKWTGSSQLSSRHDDGGPIASGGGAAMLHQRSLSQGGGAAFQLGASAGFRDMGGTSVNPPSLQGGVLKGNTFISRNVLPASAAQNHGHSASHPPGLGTKVLRGDTANVGASANTNALTDLTKRKGWSSRIVEELLDFVHVLDPNGRILFASPSIGDLTGWRVEQLKGKKMTEFVHPDDVALVERNLSQSLELGRSEIHMYFRFRRRPSKDSGKPSRSPSDTAGDVSSGDGVPKKAKREPRFDSQGSEDDDEYVVFEFTGHPYFPPEEITLAAEEDILKQAAEVTGASLVPSSKSGVSSDSSTPTPSKAEAKAKEKEKKKEAKNTSKKSKVTPGKPDELQCFFCSCRVYPTKNISMLDSFLELKIENERLRLMLKQMNMSEENLGSAIDKDVGQAAYNPDLIQAELELALRQNSIDGSSAAALAAAGTAIGGPWRQNSNLTSASASLSRSASGAFGQASPTSPRGADGTLIDDDDDDDGTGGDEKRRKKKPKADDDDYVCTDCGRVDSPEWRKGPLGPKTLCNACGLRWAKRIKRKGGDPNAPASAFHQSGGRGFGDPLGSPTTSSMDDIQQQHPGLPPGSGNASFPPPSFAQ